MKIAAWLAAAALGAGTLFIAGCATATAEQGDLVYYDEGYSWWWCEGFGWRYAGFYGHGRPMSIAAHRPPQHGERPHPGLPGHRPPCFFFLQKGGRVLASDDGRSFHEAGTLANGHFTPAEATGMPLDWILTRPDRRRSLEGAGVMGHVAARPVGGFQRFVTNTLNSVRGNLGSSWSRGPSAGGSFSGGGRSWGAPSGSGRSGGGWSRSSGSYSRGSGGWSHSSGGGGGGASRGGGGGGGGGSRGGGGGGHRDR